MPAQRNTRAAVYPGVDRRLSEAVAGQGLESAGVVRLARAGTRSVLSAHRLAEPVHVAGVGLEGRDAALDGSFPIAQCHILAEARKRALAVE